MKVHIRPGPRKIEEDHGIGRVVHAQYKHLNKFDIELVPEGKTADVYAGHTQRFDMPRVDCLHSHGIYWTGDPGSGQYTGWHHGVNHKIVEAAREAVAITVPSEWVAMPFKRDMRISPRVIGHGIEVKEWKPGKPKGYTLWNKNRPTDVCDPTPAWELANRGAQVVSTFSTNRPVPETMKVTGRLPSNEMKDLIRGASVYLATTKETFGIGTLEAMACGVPILGYAWGGTADIVTHGKDSWLVNPGDVEALWKGLDWILAHRDEMGQAARETAQRYDWIGIIEQYARLYHEIAEQVRSEPQGVSIIITNYNYAAWVCEAADSALKQTRMPDEIIVVDDGSTDDSLKRLEWYGVGHPNVKIIAQKNLGVAAARSAGIQAATQEYLVCLDADDRLEPMFIESLLPAMIADRSLGIAYSGISVNYPDGGRSVQKDWPPEFSWDSQSIVSNPPSNCIPSSAIFRKEMWERAGPHKQEYAPGEDTEFWTRGLSIGFKARRVTSEPLFWYRAHPASASRHRAYRPIDDRMPWMRDRQFPMAAPLKDSIPPIRSYSDPLVSVIIPVGSGHTHYLPDALDSLLGQTLREWEVIVIDDTYQLKSNGKKDELVFHSEFDFSILRRYPFIVFDLSPKDARGAGGARNVGLKLAKAPLVLFLDADDVLLPNALAEMTRAYIASGGRYVYSDYHILKESGPLESMQSADYGQAVWLDRGLHGVTAIAPREWIEQAGGFDTRLSGWEEGDLFTRMAIRGFCGVRVPQALLVYRDYSGQRRKDSEAQAGDILKHMRERYGEYLSGGKAMGSCCGGNGDTLLKAKAILDQMPAETRAVDTIIAVDSQTVRMEFVGPQVGAITFFGKAREYRGGNNPIERFADIDPQDAVRMEGTGQWRRVVVVPATVPVDDERQASQWENDEVEAELFKEFAATSNWLMPPDESVVLAEDDIEAEEDEPKPRKRGRPKGRTKKNRERIVLSEVEG